MKALCLCSLALLCAVPALASVTVNSPANGATVTSPFTFAATASPCSSQTIASMGYSLDSSSNTTVAAGASMSASISAALGAHVLHVKSWGSQGASCTANVTITVVQSGTGGTGSTNVVVSSPVSGASLTSPFSLLASGTLCQGQTITAFGYSLDGSTSTTIVTGTSVSASLSAGGGSHTLHVKSWGKSGSSCINDVPLTITVPTSAPSIPSNATVTKAIHNLSKWTAQHDAGTSGTSTGVMSLVTSPAVSNSARQFATTYTNYGGERYNVEFAKDKVSTNFVYDTQIYIASPSTAIANIEMDLNQTMSNGQTVIFGFQCDGWSRTWDYTGNSGTPTSPVAHWIHSTQSCNPQQWTTNTWHHVQVQYSRDSSGNVTYKAVWLDGVEQDINVTTLSAFALGWAPSLNTNFQVDGYTSTSGASTIYLDNLMVYSW
jgi:hypothetical protein